MNIWIERMSLRKLLMLSLGLIFILLGFELNAEPLDFAPSGELRMGLYSGSPSSLVINPSTNERVGLGYELGLEFSKAQRLKYAPIVYPKNADVFNAAKDGSVDLIFTNATPVRAQSLQFSKPVVRIERGYLVSSKGTIRSAVDIDRTGVRVGVSVGSSSETELPKILKLAMIVQTTSIAGAIGMLKNGELDAFSTNKGILFEMADQWAQAQVLDDVLGYEHIALGIPKARAVDMLVVNNFIDELRRNGQLKKMIERAGLRGVKDDE